MATAVGEQPIVSEMLPPDSEMLVIDLGKSEKRLDEKVAMGKRATFNYARELGSQSAYASHIILTTGCFLSLRRMSRLLNDGGM
jgi:hypothetical protein